MSAQLVFVHVPVDMIEVFDVIGAKEREIARAALDAGTEIVWHVRLKTGASRRTFPGKIKILDIADHPYTYEEDIEFLFNGKKFLMTVDATSGDSQRAFASPIK